MTFRQLKIVQADITTLDVDAVVNSANPSVSRFREWGGIDGAIHRAAGPQLLEDFISAGGFSKYGIIITGGYNLPAKHVIHIMCPIWRDGSSGEEEALTRRYKYVLRLAEDKRYNTIAFPLISSGWGHFPEEIALNVAVKALNNQQFLDVTLALMGDDRMELARKLYPELVQ